MSDTVMILLTPVLIFLIVALFGFVGCASFSAVDEPPAPPPEQKPPETTPPVTNNPPPPVTQTPVTYEQLVTEKTVGCVAFWPLNETIGKAAACHGLLKGTADGAYKSAAGPGDPTLGSYSLGKQGVLFPQDMTDYAVQFEGTEAFIEVPFVDQLNIDPTLPFSIELWVKPDPSKGADRGVLVSSHHFDSISQQQGYEIGLLKVAGQTHHQVYGRVYASSGATTTEITVQPADGDPSDWRHIVLRYGVVPGTGLSLRLHVQVLKQMPSTPGATSTLAYDNVTTAKSATLRFAGSHPSTVGGGVALFAGLLDNIAFYNANLSDADIKAHYDKVNV